MTFDEVLDQVRELLQQRGRVTYRALKRRFDLDDEYLEDLKGELIDAERVAVDEDGKVLVWIGEGTEEESGKRGSGESEKQQTTPSDSRPQTLDARPHAGERRQLTVEFIDLVGSTTLSQQLDPEDYHARVVAYQTACHQVIARYEGHIAQYLGDGVLVYFGYPTAHEEDAVRAVRSGLEIVAAVSQLAYTPPLQVRIGIHTGPVVVGEIGAGERTETVGARRDAQHCCPGARASRAGHGGDQRGDLSLGAGVIRVPGPWPPRVERHLDSAAAVSRRAGECGAEPL